MCEKPNILELPIHKSPSVFQKSNPMMSDVKTALKKQAVTQIVEDKSNPPMKQCRTQGMNNIMTNLTNRFSRQITTVPKP